MPKGGELGSGLMNEGVAACCLRLVQRIEDGSAVFLSESIDKAHNGKGYVFAMKPLKIGTDDCSVMYVMQGVDQ